MMVQMSTWCGNYVNLMGNWSFSLSIILKPIHVAVHQLKNNKIK